MADYTQDEITEAVSKVVQGAIRRPYGALGTRDTTTGANDLLDACSGVFILKPNAPFYVVFLGAQRLLSTLAELESELEETIESIENSNRHVTVIDNLAPLNNARVALDALSQAAGQRTSIFSHIPAVSAFQRFDDNIQVFLNESSKNARRNNSIVPTPQESRAALPLLIQSILKKRQVVLDRVRYLTQAIEDFDALQLPSLIASGVITKARNVLESRISELEALSPQERLSRIRAVTLDLLAGRAAVAGLGSAKSTTTFALLEGVGAAYADTAHPAIPASLPATILGPYPVYVGSSSLDFVLDSAFPFLTPLPGSYLAQADSSIPEPYIIDAGDNDKLIFDVESSSGTSRTTVTLTAGTRTSLQLATNINAAMPPGLPVLAESVIQTFKFKGLVQADATGSPGDIDFVLPSPGTWEAVGARQGDVVRVTDPLSLNFGAEYEVDPTGVNGDTLTCSHVSGPAPADEALIEIETGVGKTLRMRIRDGFELQALTERIALIFPNLPTNTALSGNPYAVTPVVQALGYQLGARIQCRSTTAAQIAEDLPKLASTQLSGVARLAVEAEFVPTVWNGLGRTDPDNPNVLVAYRMRGRGAVGVGQLGLVFTVTGATAAGVAVGDVMVIRETPVTADFNAQGTVIAVSPQSIIVNMVSPVSGGTDLLFEIGPNLILASTYLEASISSSTSQDGFYFMEVRRNPVIAFEFPMEGLVPEHRGAGGQPVFFNLALGYSRVVFKSTTTDLTTKIEVTAGTDSAALSFFSSVPVSAVGTTAFYQIPADPKSLQLGDQLEITRTVYNIIDSIHEVVGLELSQLLVEVDPTLPTDFGVIAMSLISVPPFARIRLVKKNNYTLLQQSLLAWLALAPNQIQWERDLYRLVNPITNTENPTLTTISTASTHVKQFLGVLTRAGAITANANADDALESLLALYDVSPVEEVDTLIHTYQERGADRGLDVLLQGRFQAFFGLSAEAMSYDGAMREALREVQRSDLPIRKTGRTQDLSTSRTISEWEDTDFEFDQSDTDGTVDVEIPGDFTEITPPGR